ncbi:MAG: RsmD family RNA methyltransferase [Cyanobium sp.]
MTLRLSGGRRLQSPPGATARPTAARVRQAVFNLLRAELPGCRWLDLCCGSGVMACEALQQGAAAVVAIERDRRIAAVALANLKAVASSLTAGERAPRLQVIQADARRWLAINTPASQHPGAVSAPVGGGGRSATGIATTMQQANRSAGAEAITGSVNEATPTALIQQAEPPKPFDLIYCDPPWPAGLHGPLSEAVLRGGWIQPGGTMVWECPSAQLPSAPPGWQLRDQRRYGGSTVVLLSPL